MLLGLGQEVSAQEWDVEMVDSPVNKPVRKYFVTLPDGSAVPEVRFVTQPTRGDKPPVVAVTRSDSMEVARFYTFSIYGSKKTSCLGYEPRSRSFVIELHSLSDYGSAKDLVDIATRFMRQFTRGTVYADVPLQLLCSAAADGEPVATAILDKAAKKSKGKLKKRLPSLKCTGYDIQRDYWELNAKGDFNPFDFQIANMKEDYVKKQAKRFGYRGKLDRESILRQIDRQDRETIEFVSAQLKIERKKR